MRATFSLLAAALTANVCSAQKVIDLSGSGWTLQNSNHSITVPGKVPSQQYLDLYEHGTIGNPLFGFNDDLQSWVTLDNWTYTSPPIGGLQGASPFRPGHGPPGFSQNSPKTWLVFQGLDTFVHITMCGKEVGNTDSQWRQWTFDVSEILPSCHGEPRLSLNFGSAVNITHDISNGASADPNANFADGCNDSSEFGCKAYARKEQNDFGWDWSPSLAPAGPWRPIFAVQLTEEEPVYVNNALIDIYRRGQRNNLSPDQSQPWVFNASLDFLGDLPHGAGLQMTLKDAGGREVMSAELSDVSMNNMTITGSTSIDPSKVELWWPSGMGAQNLYDATISIVSGHRPVTQVERRVGFRTIVLNFSPITPEQSSQGIAPGANWHFEINGHEMYAKGSNLVPPSPFWPTVNETKIRQLFELVVEGNQNMLRVWASGVYLDDWIYDIADEMGILLWSEFAFTDAEYPNTTHFLQNYEAEAYYNVRRINHHASLALWAGGNELEQVILAFFFSATDPGAIQREYEQIFLELLIKCVYANSRSISYMPSSTYHGYLSLDFDRVMPQIPRYENTSGPDAIYANTDYYGPVQTAFDLSTYPLGRFADEFGIESMPSLQSWRTEAPESDLFFDSPTVVHHNRHTIFGSSGSAEDMQRAGVEEMATAVNLYYPTPNMDDQIANFTAWIYATQVFQADLYQHEIAFYRRGSGMPERQLGALYWMLDDLWAAPSWASIDVLNRQKILYYTTKDIFQPVIVYGYYNLTTHDLQVWATSDLWSSVSGTVTYEWLDFSGKPLSLASKHSKSSASVPFTIGAINSTKILEYDDVHSILGNDTSNAVLRLSVTGHSEGQTYTHTSWFHPTFLSNVTLVDPGLTLSHNAGGGRFDERAFPPRPPFGVPNHQPSTGGSRNTVSFTVKASKAVAAWVWLDYSSPAVQGFWSDNGFWLNKGESKTVTFTVWNDWSRGQWVDTVSVRSLWDNTLH